MSRTKAIIFRVPVTLYDSLQEYCDREELTISQVNRKALRVFLETQGVIAPTPIHQVMEELEIAETENSGK